MKRLLLVLFFVPLISFSQTKDAFELCYAYQQKYKQFDSNFEANDALERILNVTGAKAEFVLMECDKIRTALAVTYKGERYILYDKEFMSLISKNTNSWSNIFILAHEVAHHINGHTKDIALGDILSEQELEEQRKEELDADYYAGFVLAKLGASLSQTNAAMNFISTDRDDRYSTHPNRNKRVEAITRGWNDGVEIDVSQTNNNSTSSKEFRTSSWVQYKSGKNSPFDEEEIYAYVIGNTFPIKSSTYNVKPKFIVELDNYSHNFFITDLNAAMNNDFDINYDIHSTSFNITSIPQNELYEIIKREISDSNAGFIESVINKSKEQMSRRTYPSSTLEKLYIGKSYEFIEFEVVFDDVVKKWYGTKNFFTGVIEPFNPNQKHQFIYFAYIAEDMRVNSNVSTNLLNAMKLGNKLFIKPNINGGYSADYSLKIPSQRFMQAGLNQWDTFQLQKNLYIDIDVEITLKRKTENTIFDGESYFEFSLSGSTKALSFD